MDILAPKSPARLAAAREMYEARYDKSLMDLLDDETSGWFEGDFNLIIKALLTRSEVDDEAEADEGAAEEVARGAEVASRRALLMPTGARRGGTSFPEDLTCAPRRPVLEVRTPRGGPS